MATSNKHPQTRPTVTVPPNSVMNIRIRAADKVLLDTAAKAVGKSRSEFVMDVARIEAERVLLDQRVFMLDPKRYDEFVAILDSPPVANLELKRLLKQTPPWK